MFDTPDFSALDRKIDEQFAITKLSRQKGRKQEPGILIYLDDMTDNPAFTNNSRLLSKLYARGRHAQISVVPAVYRMRNVLNRVVFA